VRGRRCGRALNGRQQVGSSEGHKDSVPPRLVAVDYLATCRHTVITATLRCRAMRKDRK
jgi:hypothetical protein